MSRAYRYYDSPDGYDLFLKTEYLVRRIGLFSSGLALVDVTMITQPKSYFAMAERFARLFFPPIIAGGIFTTTVYIATNLRKKDDSYNHVLGGILGACYINKLLKNTPIVWCYTIPILFLLAGYKDMKMLDNCEFQPDTTDNLLNVGTPVIEYDMMRKSMFANKNHTVYAGWFN